MTQAESPDTWSYDVIDLDDQPEPDDDTLDPTPGTPWWRRPRPLIALAATTAFACAATVVTVLHWNDNSGPTKRFSTSMPLKPKNWPVDSPLAAPTKVYPLVHPEPGAAEPPNWTREQWEFQYAYKQKTAEVLDALLPDELGPVQIYDDNGEMYQLLHQGRRILVWFRMDDFGRHTMDMVRAQGNCIDQNSNSRPGCTTARLPDGTPIAVYPQGIAGLAPDKLANWGCFFLYRGLVTEFSIGSDPGGPFPLPITDPERIARVVTDPRFVQLLDFRAAHYDMLRSGYYMGFSDDPQ
ncbi:hypothetical protein [Yinghuangia seranimata]|uniref:hypothetical protein n=1 Tax=Yinghuangia seranimata TaxID=408067 RepID=UPI00248C9F5F|nr:hypothetical protein [Yinghuangia seranimata]MDI2128856.1 hypothetical protein [Yinghuangia seranimata]